MENIRELIAQMTLEEKAGLCSGLDFWHTKPVERLGIPSIMMTDGPHGLRKQADTGDHLGLNVSTKATCFPTGSALACSWDRSLLETVGQALAEECRDQGVSILLGPAANIKRSPLCGRNFEYYSEDPVLSSELAASIIHGIQSKGVGASLKHFAANNMETRRMTVDTRVDERTLREIYLASFEGAVKKSQPWTVMCAYNKVNGDFCSENRHLLTEMLKEDWGHEGFVMSDWGAVNDRAAGLAAGLELEMPGSGGANDQKIAEAVRSGRLPEKALDDAVERILKVVFRAAEIKKEPVACDYAVHHRLARKAAAECAVLLKNENGLLPLSKTCRIGVFGAFAKGPRFQGGGSSHINPQRVDIPLDAIREAAGDARVDYAQGYASDEAGGTFAGRPFFSNADTPDEALLAEAAELAKRVDVAVVFAGLPESYESEGYDRRHMRIPEGHSRLIEAVAAVQPNVVVVLNNGSPVEMPWLGKVRAVLECYLGGEGIGAAAADLLFGASSPSGRLAETFPERLCDNPSYLNFPGDSARVEYREGLFVGYRYYDAKQVKPLFPFGFGLSYTSFAFTGMRVDKRELTDAETLEVRVAVRNTGGRTGTEVVQLYVSDVESNVIRPVKELKDFARLELAPGEEKEAVFTLDKRAFAYYDEKLGDWVVKEGDFRILAARSAAEIVLEETVHVKPAAVKRIRYNLNTPLDVLQKDPRAAGELHAMMNSLGTAMGMPEGEEGGMFEMFRQSPLRCLTLFTQGKVSEGELLGILQKLNDAE